MSNKQSKLYQEKNSYRGKDLSGHNFSNRDIRGFDFTNAILVGANFAGAKAGITDRKRKLLIANSSILSFIICIPGLLFGFAFILNTIAASILKVENISVMELILKQIPNFLQYFIMLFIIVFQGLNLKSLRNTILISIFITILMSMIQFPQNHSSFLELIHRDKFLKNTPGPAIVAYSWLMAVFIGLTINTFSALLINISIFIMIISISVPFFISLSTKINGDISQKFKLFVIKWIILLFLAPLPAALTSNLLNSFLPSMSLFSFSNLYKIVFSLMIFLGIQFYISYFIAFKSVTGDTKFSVFKDLISHIISRFGTCFYGANLSRADFGKSELINSDLRHTNLTEVIWIDSFGIEFSLVDEMSILNDEKILKLLTSKNISDGDFSRKVLTGVNLKGFNLRNIDFSGSDLSEANLAGADLFEAKFIDTGLEKTNLEGAILTGAYIENWGATKTTQFNNVHCDYIYRRLPTTGRRDPNRMPPEGKGNFKAGEFQDFAKSIIGTLELYHSNNFDSRAVAIVLQELADEYKGELSIVEFEHKDNGQVVVKIQTDQLIDHTLVGKKYYSRYEEVQKSLPPNGNKVSNELEYLESAIRHAEQDNSNEKRIIRVVVRSGTAYIATSEKGDATVIDNSKNIVNSNITNNAPGSFNFGDTDINGTVTSTINQLASPSVPNIEDVKNLLLQIHHLHQAVESESELSLEDKENLLEQIKVFAEAKNISDEKTKNRSVGNAKKYSTLY